MLNIRIYSPAVQSEGTANLNQPIDAHIHASGQPRLSGEGRHGWSRHAASHAADKLLSGGADCRLSSYGKGGEIWVARVGTERGLIVINPGISGLTSLSLQHRRWTLKPLSRPTSSETASSTRSSKGH